MKKRFISVFLCLCLTFTLAPTAAVAGGSTATTAPVIQLGYSGMQAGDTFYLGHEGYYPIQWYMVNRNTTANTALAVSRYTLGESTFGTNYATSALKTAMEDKFTNDFSVDEKMIIKRTTLSGDTMAAGCSSVENARLFPMYSMQMTYLGGFATAMAKAEPIENEDGNTLPAGSWWLRDTNPDYPTYTEIINSAGSLGTSLSTNKCGIRPSFVMDTSSILMISQVGQKISGIDGVDMLNDVGKYTVDAAKTSKWILTLTDSRFQYFRAWLDSSSSSTVVAGNTIKLKFDDSYDYTVAHPNEYISMVLVDSSNNILYYGRMDVDGNVIQSTKELRIPAGLATGQYKLKVYKEEWNRDDGPDYASAFSDISLSVKGKHSITIRGYAYSNPTSAASGETVTLYPRPDKGYRLKDWKVLKGSITIKADNTFIMPDEDVEVSVDYEPIPTYTVSVTPAITDFGGKSPGYTPPDAKTVTVTNTGNQTVTLTKTDPADYTVSALTASSLAPGKTAAFTVQPKTGLGVGTYNESVVVSTANGTSATAAVKFSVSELTAAVSPAASAITHGDSQTLTAQPSGGSGDYTYKWYVSGAASPFASTKEVTVTPDATTSYRLAVNDGTNEKEASATVTVNPRKYKVTFNSNGSDFSAASQSVTEGGTATEPTGLTSASGEIFRGWYTDSECTAPYDFTATVSADITLYVKWEAPKTYYTVTFDSQGGSNVDSQKIESGKTAAEPAASPTRAGYVFRGWYTDAACTAPYDFTAPVSASFTLHAKWAMTLTVIFDGNGGSGSMNTYTAVSGEAFTLPDNGFTPPKGMKFSGWAVGSPTGTKVNAGDTYTFTEPTAVFAVWNDIPTSGTGTSTGGNTSGTGSSTSGTGSETSGTGSTSAVTSASQSGVTSPATGDMGREALWVALFAAAAGAFASLELVRERRKRSSRKD
jgi:uncharacterized repeat protein (TIGR02543 family)